MKTKDIMIVHPSSDEQVTVLKAFFEALKIKFEFSKGETYNPEFVAKIEKSRKDYKDGNFVTVEKKELSKFLGLE